MLIILQEAQRRYKECFEACKKRRCKGSQAEKSCCPHVLGTEELLPSCKMIRHESRPTKYTVVMIKKTKSVETTQQKHACTQGAAMLQRLPNLPQVSTDCTFEAENLC